MTTLGQPAPLNVSSASPISSTTIVPAPTALPTNAVLLGLVSDHSFVDDLDTLNIVGEVRNDSPSPVNKAVVEVTFYDDAGTIIGTTQANTLLNIIPAGDIAPFRLSLGRPSGLASYSLRAIGQAITPAGQPQLTVVQVRRFEDNIGFYHIKGVIKNAGQTLARRVSVAAILYGRDGSVVNVGQVETQPSTLEPGATAEYDVIFTYYPRYTGQQVIPFVR